MSEQEAHTLADQHIIVKLLYREGVKLAEILRRLTAQFLEKTLSMTQVYEWHKQFPMAKSQCKMRPMHAERGQAPVR